MKNLVCAIYILYEKYFQYILCRFILIYLYYFCIKYSVNFEGCRSILNHNIVKIIYQNLDLNLDIDFRFIVFKDLNKQIIYTCILSQAVIFESNFISCFFSINIFFEDSPNCIGGISHQRQGGFFACKTRHVTGRVTYHEFLSEKTKNFC